jgi:sigma54-dependent transcription regulator
MRIVVLSDREAGTLAAALRHFRQVLSDTDRELLAKLQGTETYALVRFSENAIEDVVFVAHDPKALERAGANYAGRPDHASQNGHVLDYTGEIRRYVITTAEAVGHE